jgi:hypothetical protein
VAYLLASSLPSTERSFPASWRGNLGEEERIARARPLVVGFLLRRKAVGGALRCSKHPGTLGPKPLPFHTTDPSTTLLAQLEAMKLLTWELSLPHSHEFTILTFKYWVFFFFPFFLFFPLFFLSCLK